jgi:hypothetical protein
MKPLNEDGLRELFARAHIDAADVARGIGQQLSYRSNARRTIVIHLAETHTLEYCIDVISRVLELDDEWLLIPRYGSVRELELMAEPADAEALSFMAAEKHALATYLCSRSTGLAAISADLYVLGRRGDILITWDHHSAVEGISIELQSVGDAGRLLASLNEFGVELDLFYTE